ncbi:MAG: histidine kinase N-terminal 7TM domain-containing diguanylate cyclase [Bacillota bacterium]|jgi:diguanylate cyclase (GGDEF)-like protein
MKTLLSLYLVLAVILAQFFSAYFFSKGRTSYRKAFSALVLCISIYLFGYLMIVNSSNLQEMIFWNQFQYLGLPFIAVLWLTVALLYTKTIPSLKTRTVLLLFAVPATTFLIRLTNHWHHFFYTNWEMRQFFDYYSLYMERGFWYYVNISYTILCLLFTVIIYFIGYLKHKAGYTKSHFLVFLFASLMPLIGIALVVFYYGQRTIDYSALIMPVSLLVISYGILRYDFLEIKTLARETIFENNFAGMLVLGPGKRVIDYNKAAKNFFKAFNVSLNNSPIEHLLEQEPKLLEIFTSEESRDLSLVIDGEKRFFEIDAVLLGDAHDGNTRMLKSIRDVTEERKIQEKLKFLATTDSLSGLYNRAEFMNLAKREFARAKRNSEELSMLIMDLDNFKAINDTFGHAAGDEVIREMGSMILTNFRKTDMAGRIGGEEFAVLLKNASLAEAKVVAEKFRETVAKRKVSYREQEIGLTVSIGVAAISGDSDDINHIEDLLKLADDAMYKAKAKGRNHVVTLETGVEGEAQLEGKTGKPASLPNII